MPQITRELIRKRAEHNEGIISTLEEITLHQEEIESLNEVLGMTCRKLKILYLQNNIIPRMQNLQHLKDLQYLNMALNNVSRVEGLSNCEFLKKLDLTVNFIDLDALKDSIEHLAERPNLTDLYMMGNPAQSNWDKFNQYVVAKIPQLQNLDGTEITRSLRIQATQKLPAMEAELAKLAEKVRIEKEKKAAEGPKKLKKGTDTAKYSSASAENKSDEVTVEDAADDEEEEPAEEDPNEMTDNTPEARVEIYKELAAQKKEKEDRERANRPRERDYDEEQRASIEKVRRQEEEAGEREIKQKNEGGWEFHWDEESRPGFVVLDVKVQRHLDSSLIDVDVHPRYLSVVIKSKVLRLRLPAEVKVAESKCQRSKVSGSLMIVMPKVNPNENAISIRGDKKQQQKQKQQQSDAENRVSTGVGRRTCTVTSSKPKKLSLQEQMMAEAAILAAGGDPNSLSSSSSSAESGGDRTALLDKNIGRGSTASANRVDISSIVRKSSMTEQAAATTTAMLSAADVATTSKTTTLVQPISAATKAPDSVVDDLKAIDESVFKTSARVVELE